MWRRRSPPKAPTSACWSAKPAISKILKASPATPLSATSRSPSPSRLRSLGCDAVVHVAADYRLWIRDPARHVPRQRRRHARAAAPGPRSQSPARRLHLQRRHHALPHRRHRHQRRHAGLAQRHGRPLQAVEISGRAAGHRRRRRTASRSSSSTPPRPSAPTTPSPRPPAASSSTFSTANFPAYVDTGLNLVDVAEVARTHVAALTKGKPGRRYILGGENLTLKQILDKMSAITGIPSPTTKIPFAVAATYAFFEEWITGRIRGKEPRATLEEVRMGRKKMFASRRARSRNSASASCPSIRPCAPPSSGSAPTATRRKARP